MAMFEIVKNTHSVIYQVLLLKNSVFLGVNSAIKGEGIPKGTRLLKAYATSTRGPRRIVFLLEVGGGDLFLLFYRDKTDKIGANITIKNKAFKLQLWKHLDDLLADIESGDFEVIKT